MNSRFAPLMSTAISLTLLLASCATDDTEARRARAPNYAAT